MERRNSYRKTQEFLYVFFAPWKSGCCWLLWIALTNSATLFLMTVYFYNVDLYETLNGPTTINRPSELTKIRSGLLELHMRMA
jgi:hypothetical protein